MCIAVGWEIRDAKLRIIFTCLGISTPEADLAIVDVVVRVGHGRRRGRGREELEFQPGR